MSIKARISSLIVGLATVAAAMFTAPAAIADGVTIGGGYPNAALINISASGSIGSRMLLGDQWCTKFAGYRGGIDAATTYVFRTPAYPYSTQVITQQVRLDQLVNGVWRVAASHPATAQTVRDGQYGMFGTVKSFTANSGVWYRVVETTSWYVNGQLVGQAQDTVNGDAIAVGGSNGNTLHYTGSGAGVCAFLG